MRLTNIILDECRANLTHHQLEILRVALADYIEITVDSLQMENRKEIRIALQHNTEIAEEMLQEIESFLEKHE